MNTETAAMNTEKERPTVLTLASAQLQGARHRQEDAFLTQWDRRRWDIGYGPLLVVVADSLGGHDDGDRAARQAVETMSRCFLAHDHAESLATADDLHRWLREADAEVRSRAPVSLGSYLPATTLVGGVFYPTEKSAHFFAVGDSFVLHHHEDRDDYVFIPDGRGSTVNHALGYRLGRPGAGIALHEIALVPGHRFLFSTDGLLTLSEAERNSALAQGSARDCTERLMQDVIGANKPKQDNVTVVAVDVGLQPELTPAERQMLDALSGLML